MSETMPNEQVASGEPQYHGAAAPGHGAEPSPYTDAEWSQFRAEDFAAGKAVVIEMLGIFLMGVAIYSTVAYFVAY